MKEEILKNYGWRKRWVRDRKTGEEIEEFYWDPNEHFETWYWLRYTGPKDKWRPPENWKDIRRRLMSQGVAYWEQYPYPKDSWRDLTKKEYEIVRKSIRNYTAKKIKANHYNIKGMKMTDKGIHFEPITWVASETYYIPSRGMLVRKWRGEEEEI